MKRRLLVVGLMALLFAAPGCQDGKGNPKADPSKYKQQAYEAGELAAAGYLVIEKPSADLVKAISGVLGQISAACKDYPEKGFASYLPVINAEIDKMLPPDTKKAENIAAKKLAEVMVSELDAAFKRHPEWKDKAVPIVELVGAFVDGGKKTLDDFLKTGTAKVVPKK